MILETHMGVCTNVGVEKEGYPITVEVDSIVQDREYEFPAFPLFPANFFKPPEKGQNVEVIIQRDQPDSDEADQIGGLVELPDLVYYGRVLFDNKSNKMPKEFKTNYPKRSGTWYTDGTIIYYDETKNGKEYFIKITDGNVSFRLTESDAALTVGNTSITLTDGKVDVSTVDVQITASGNVNVDANNVILKDSFTKLGSAAATKFLLDGTAATLDLGVFFGQWSGALGSLTSLTIPVYVAAMQGFITTLQTAIGNWESGKHSFDS